MAAGSIVIDLLMRTGSFETDTGRAEKRLKQFEKEVKDSAGRIAAGVGAVAAAIGASIAVVERFADGIAVYQDIADKIGASASAVSGLQLAADQSGTALDTVAAASVRLTAALSKTDDESDATAKALAAINIPLEEFRRLDPVAQLQRVATELASFEDGAGKTAVAVALFGKAGADILPFLNDLAEAGSQNNRLTQEQIASADQFTKTLATMRSELASTARAVAADIIPSFQAFLDYARQSEVAATLLSAAGAVLRTVFEAIAVVAANVAFVFVGVGREIGAVLAQIGALARLDISGFKAISQAVKEDAARARAELDKFEQRILNPQAVAGAVPAPAAPPRPVLSFSSARGASAGGSAARPAPAAPERQSEADRYLESLQRQLERTKDLTVTEQLLADIQAGRLGKVSAAQQASLVGVAEQIDAARRLESQLKAEDEQLRALEASQKALQDAAQRYYEETRTPLENLNAGLAEQQRLLDALGPAYEETYGRKVAQLFGQYDATFKQTGAELDDFAKNAAENIQRNFGDVLFNAMQGNFKGIGDSFTQLINRMVAEALAAKLAKALFGDLVGGEGGGAFGSILTSIGGALFGGARAGGGDVMPGRSYLVGEMGPEMFVPRTAGAIVPAAQTAAMGRQTTINAPINVAVSGAVDRRTREQIASDVRRAVEAAAARGTA